MSKPFIFKYTRVGNTCFVEDKEMEKLFKVLRKFGVAADDVVDTHYERPNTRLKATASPKARKAKSSKVRRA